MTDESMIARSTAHYPPADISPAEFEKFVVELFNSTSPYVNDLTVTLHETIRGVDGEYDFDATIRYELAGMSFLVLVEAKRHTNPIKRELVQVLNQKKQSVGGHKAVMISTAPYQSGALEFAKIHGIALVTVTEGRFTLEMRSAPPTQPATMSRAAAFARFGIPTFVGHHYGEGSQPGSTGVTIMSPEYPKYVSQYLLDILPPDQ